ncbi:12045_t:CDS:2 [Acaulospora colombiana]|uniref:12045_t:CDS:1 n=1 Tax=Acaulospora colombiana TaxID=27376 RepID=A0ACA9MK57_9GLOM|nr:12045_t:CDS:2 [Acaulospora colombiana]
MPSRTTERCTSSEPLAARNEICKVSWNFVSFDPLTVNDAKGQKVQGKLIMGSSPPQDITYNGSFCDDMMLKTDTPTLYETCADVTSTATDA